MELLLTVAYTAFFLFVIKKWKFFRIEEIPNYWIQTLFLLKLTCGIGLTFIYTYYYTDRATADIFKYFDDSLVLYNAAFSNFGDFLSMMSGIGNDNAYFDKNYYSQMNHWMRPFGSNYYNDTHIMIRLNTFFRFFSLGHFHVHNVFMNMISLIGFIALYRSFRKVKGIDPYLLFAGIALLPSILFWTSGVLKEGMILFSLGILFLSFSQLKSGNRVIYIALILISAYLMIRLKFYILLALIPGFIAYLTIKYFNFKRILIWHLTIPLFLVGIALNLKYISPEIDVMKMMAQKQTEFICLAEYMNSGSQITLSKLTENPVSLFTNLPSGLINSFIRPYPWEIDSLFTAFSFVENLLLLILAIIVIKKRQHLDPNTLNLFYSCISFILILFMMIGITTPVLGALVRYKVPGSILLIIALAILSNQNLLPKFGSNKSHGND